MEIVYISSENWVIKEGFSTKGRRDKFFVEKNEDNYPVYLFKQPKESAKVEIWTEIIACKIGELFQINVPQEVQPAKYRDDYGVLVKSFLEPGESLLHAQDLLKYFNPNSKYYHNIKSAKEILDYSKEGGWSDFKKMLIFDCVIGNNDRHDENWGICFNINNKTYRMTPAYDNASCLARELPEDRIIQLLSDEVAFMRYINNSRPPNLYWSLEEPVKYKHFELIKKLIEFENNTLHLLETFLIQIDNIEKYVNVIIKEIQEIDVPQDYKISDNRSNLIKKIINQRLMKIMEISNVYS